MHLNLAPQIRGLVMSLKVKVASDLNTLPEECVVPLKPADAPSTGTVKLRLKACDAAPVSSAPVKITINDCLMCSGCVTSAEEVFFRELNTTALQNAITSGPKAGRPIVLSLSQSAILSLSRVLLDITSVEPCTVDTLFKQLEYALRTRVAGLRHCTYEDAPPVCVVSEAQHQEQSVLMNVRQISFLMQSSEPRSNIAIITHCPAVRLFITKRNRELISYIVSTASPMELFGASYCGIDASPLLVSIQPCQDRKLEQFRGAAVDVCLTAQEVHSFLAGTPQGSSPPAFCSSYTPSPTSFWQYALGPLLVLYLRAKDWISDEGLSRLLVQRADGVDLHWTKIGNELFSCTIELSQNQSPYSCVIIYKSTGYHNLQNLVRRIHALCPNKSALYILDLHACPYGCYGGACIAGDDRHPVSSVASASHAATVSADKAVLSHILAADTCAGLLEGLVQAVDRITPQETVIRTDGEVVSPEEIAARKGIQGGVRIQDLAW